MKLTLGVFDSVGLGSEFFRRGLFAEKLDYFMIFGVYLRSMIERKAGTLLKDLNWC